MDVGAQPLSRLRGLALSPQGVRRLALVNAAALVLIIATGATVRLTGSGLGCEHWPGCQPHHFEPRSFHSYIEFGNRVIAFLTILTTLATWIFARGHRRLAGVIFVGTLAQAPLGYLAVHSDLHWPVVAAHLLLSMALLAGAVVLALETLALRSGSVEPFAPRELRTWSLAVAAAAGVLLVTGTLATAGGPHSGGGAQHVDRLWRLQPLIYVHAASVAVFAVALVFVLGYLASGRARWPRLFALGGAVFAVLLVQMGLGELQYRTHLPWELVLVHVGLAAAVWGLLVAFVTVLWRPPAALAPTRT